MAKRIDSLKPGTPVRLKFCAESQGKNAAYEEDATFVALTGEGDDRRATFSSPDQRVPGEDRVWFQWDAYRYKGRWAYGSSAETLRLLEVKS